MKWYLRGEPRLFAFTWGHRPRIWVPFKELIKASSQGPPSEPAGPGELKGDMPGSRNARPYRTKEPQTGYTRAETSAYLHPGHGPFSSQLRSQLCRNSLSLGICAWLSTGHINKLIIITAARANLRLIIMF